MVYLLRGRIPWSLGYYEYKWEAIKASLRNRSLLQGFRSGKILKNYGKYIDERIVEYPWAISNLSRNRKSFLDAGSVFNFQTLLEDKKVANKELTICTYYPEDQNFNKKGVSYIYKDLRNLPFKSNLFDEIACLSTLEHIDMDNSIYGYDISNSAEKMKKSYEYLKVIAELERVLKKRGLLLLSFPYGEFYQGGFFQQFDSEMVGRIQNYLKQKGEFQSYYFQHTKSGWVSQMDSNDLNGTSYHPRKQDDKYCVCEICCIKFVKD